MREFNIDRADPAALHEQVAAQLRRAIAEGEALPGERLPPARDLAAVLGVNTNTVLRALASSATRASSSSGAGARTVTGAPEARRRQGSGTSSGSPGATGTGWTSWSRSSSAASAVQA